MAFSSASGNSIADINITPLVDVMLVLLVIFMVTVPAVSYSLPMDLRQGDRSPPTSSPAPIRIHVSASATLEWNGQPVSLTELRQRFGVASEAAGGNVKKQPLVRIDVDSGAEYELLAKVMARANNAGLTRIALDDPPRNR